MRFRSAAVILVVLAAACSTPSGPPPPPPPPPDPGPQTAPIIRAITVPTSRVEAGTDIALTATVEDAETPLTQLTYQWAASAGTITGSGTTATWTMPRGITAGVDVVITLTVVDTYNALLNGQIVQRQYTVIGTSTPFRVHDSEAELLRLSVKFLKELFGNSAIAPAACLVDFSDVCANYEYGKAAELKDIAFHRTQVEVLSVTFITQSVAFSTVNNATVTSYTMFLDRWLVDNRQEPYWGDFILSAVYHDGRWWLCESRVFTRPGGGSARAMALYGGLTKSPVVKK